MLTVFTCTAHFASDLTCVGMRAVARSRHAALRDKAGQNVHSTALNNVEASVGDVHACGLCTTMLCICVRTGSRHAWLQLVESISYNVRAMYSRLVGFPQLD